MRHEDFGSENGELEVELAVRDVRTRRIFTLSSFGELTGLSHPQLLAEGVNVASCQATVPCNSSPGVDCTCGFYGYDADRWVDKRSSNALPESSYVRAMVRLSGRLVVGQHGVRAAHMELLGYVLAPADRYLLPKLVERYPSAKNFSTMKELYEAFPPTELEREEPAVETTSSLMKKLQLLSPPTLAKVEQKLYPLLFLALATYFFARSFGESGEMGWQYLAIVTFFGVFGVSSIFNGGWRVLALSALVPVVAARILVGGEPPSGFAFALLASALALHLLALIGSSLALAGRKCSYTSPVFALPARVLVRDGEGGSTVVLVHQDEECKPAVG